MHSAASCLGLPELSCCCSVSRVTVGHPYYCTYVFVRLVLVLVLAQIVLVVLIVFEIIGIEVVVFVADLFERKSLTGEPIDGPRDQLLLDVLAKLVVQLQTLLNLRAYLIFLIFFVIVIGRRLGRGEEVEERLSGDLPPNYASLLRS